MKKLSILLVTAALALAPLAQAADSCCPKSKEAACCATCKESCACKEKCACKQADASKACGEKGKCASACKEKGGSGNDKKS